MNIILNLKTNMFHKQFLIQHEQHHHEAIYQCFYFNLHHYQNLNELSLYHKQLDLRSLNDWDLVKLLI